MKSETGMPVLRNTIACIAAAAVIAAAYIYLSPQVMEQGGQNGTEARKDDIRHYTEMCRNSLNKIFKWR